MIDTASQKTYDLITFGDLCVDLVMSGPDVTPEFGQVEKLVSGSCSIFACTAARLSLRMEDNNFGHLILRWTPT